MTPAMIALIAQYALEYGLPAARKLVELFRTPAPTWDQWDDIFALSEKPFDDYVKPTPTP